MKYLTDIELNVAQTMVNKSQYEGDVSIRKEYYDQLVAQAKAYNKAEADRKYVAICTDTRLGIAQDRIDRLSNTLAQLVANGDTQPEDDLAEAQQVLNDEKLHSHYDDKVGK